MSAFGASLLPIIISASHGGVEMPPDTETPGKITGVIKICIEALEELYSTYRVII